MTTYIRTKSYETKQREFVNQHNLKASDKVLVLRKLSEDDPTWDRLWVENMDDTVGKVGTVGEINSSFIHLTFTNPELSRVYPYYLLAKVKEDTPATPTAAIRRDPKVGDMVRVIVTAENRIFLAPRSLLFVPGMREYHGQTFKVTRVDSDRSLRMGGVDYWWAFEWVEIVEEAKDSTSPSELKPGMRVLVRDLDSERWRSTTLSEIRDPSARYRFRTGCSSWRLAIPLEGNEHLEGNTGSPSDAKPQPKPAPVLTRGMPVLVRDEDDDDWQLEVFSHDDGTGVMQYKAGEEFWYQCIPYEGNERLRDTDRSPE